MANAKFLKNVAGYDLNVASDSEVFRFKKDEVKMISDADKAQHLLQKTHVVQARGSADPPKTIILFKELTPQEGLPLVKFDEDAAAAAKKAEIEKAEKLRKEIAAQVIAELKAQGRIVEKGGSK